MTDDELHRLLAEATPGPWYLSDSGWIETEGELVALINENSLSEAEKADARLIAAAPDLAAEVLRLREALCRLVGASSDMLNVSEKSGVFDNTLAEIFPDSKRRGVRAADAFRQIDLHRNSLKSEIASARAALGDT